MKKLNLALSLIAVSLLAACTSTNDLGAGRTGQSIIISGHSYDDVWNASLTALNVTKGDQVLEINKDITIIEKNKSKGFIKAKTGMSLFSYGEVIGVFITPPKDSPKHMVEVESRSKLKTNITANNWESEVLKSIKHNIKNTK